MNWKRLKEKFPLAYPEIKAYAEDYKDITDGGTLLMFFLRSVGYVDLDYSRIPALKDYEKSLSQKAPRECVGKSFELKTLPQLYHGNPNLTVGKHYRVLSVEGSNFWVLDDDGVKCSFGSSRFIL